MYGIHSTQLYVVEVWYHHTICIIAMHPKDDSCWYGDGCPCYCFRINKVRGLLAGSVCVHTNRRDL